MRRVLILLFCLLALAGSAFAAEISSLQTDVAVSGDGTAQVTLTAEVDFTEPAQTCRRPRGSGAGDIVLSGWA